MKLTIVRFALPVVLIAMISGMAGCNWGGPIHREWTEDVLLDDGSVIQVRRTVTFNETNSLSGDAYNAVETDATLAFTGSLANLSSWKAPLIALLLYKDKATEEWAIVATSTSCDVWNRYGAPEPMYWEFRLKDQAWHEVPLSPASIGRSVNLLHRYQRDLKKAHITFRDRLTLESDPGIDKKFKEILADVRTHCTKSQKR